MNTVPNQAEEPPKSDLKPSRQHSSAPASPENVVSPASLNGSLGQRGHQSEHPTSPPVRKDTNSSTSTNFTATTQATMRSSTREDTAATTYSAVEASVGAQGVFSARDGNEVSAQRRSSRKRIGPLTPEQRKKAAYIRKLGACPDCRKRRVGCEPEHHNMTWPEIRKKFAPPGPDLPDLAPVGGRPISPATSTSRRAFTQDPQEMDVEPSPSQLVGRPVVNESRVRTPLPSGPRLFQEGPHLQEGPRLRDKPHDAAFLFSGDKPDLEMRVSQLLADPHRSRYNKVSAFLIHWQDDEDPSARAAMNELAGVLKQYNYTVQIKTIPSLSDGNRRPLFWLNREMTQFIENDNQRNVLKIVYYSGYTFCDGDGKAMVLSSSQKRDLTSGIGWSLFSQLIENATSDVLMLMDSAYYPSLRLVKSKGVLEMIAASGAEDHVGVIERIAFTRAVTRQLHTRLSEKRNALSAAELHASLLSSSSDMLRDRRPDTPRVTSIPLYFQVSMARLPSILLAPAPPAPKGSSPPPTSSPTSGGVSMNLTLRLADESIETEEWVEWLSLMPEGIRDVVVRMGGPNRDTFR